MFFGSSLAVVTSANHLKKLKVCLSWKHEKPLRYWYCLMAMVLFVQILPHVNLFRENLAESMKEAENKLISSTSIPNSKSQNFWKALHRNTLRADSRHFSNECLTIDLMGSLQRKPSKSIRKEQVLSQKKHRVSNEKNFQQGRWLLIKMWFK